MKLKTGFKMLEIFMYLSNLHVNEMSAKKIIAGLKLQVSHSL